MPMKATSPDQFAPTLRRLLAERGLSVDEFGRRLAPEKPVRGIRAVRRYLAAKHAPSPTTFDRIAALLGLTSDELEAEVAKEANQK